MDNFIENSVYHAVNINSANNSKPNREEIFLKGIPSSPGMAYGKAIVIQPDSIIIPSEHIPEEKVPDELDRLNAAIKELIQEFITVLDKVKKEAHNVVAVLETNLLILTDSVLLDSIKRRIKLGYSVENAIIQEFDEQKQYLSNAKDQILRERALDFEHIKERLIAILRNRCIFYAVEKNSVIIAQTLTPSDIVNFNESGISGIITEVGGIASHSSILARTFEIPAVIGIRDATSIIETGDYIIVDGYAGSVTINPQDKNYSLYLERKQKEEEHKRELGELIKLPSVTIDGKKISLLTNVDFPDDVLAAVFVGAEGIGLVRSEHLLMSLKHFPEEEEQYRWYKEIADRAYPNPVTIRAFDVGTDKYSEGMPKHENNPALGFRGIRFLLFRSDIFKIQVRAILRASKNKNVKLMLPMISTIKEVVASLKLIEECKNAMSEENMPFDSKMPVGIMIETPAAAIQAGIYAEYSDFFSIGTNDLTQYTIAADRTNELVSDIFDSFHPAVLRLIKMTVDAAQKKGIPVAVCGELAGHAAATSLLIGMGITELSVSPSILLELKSRVREIRYKDSKKLAKEILDLTYDKVRKKLALS